MRLYVAVVTTNKGICAGTTTVGYGIYADGQVIMDEAVRRATQDKPFEQVVSKSLTRIQDDTILKAAAELQQPRKTRKRR